jgi:hypothetical protein
MKLSTREIKTLMALMTLDTETDQAEKNWGDTTCGIHGLTKAQSNILYAKIYKKLLETNNQSATGVAK